MATFLRTNLESSILFLQQEHATTLKALHDEIAKLQKKCSELCLKLALGDSCKDDSTDDFQVPDVEETLRLSEKKNLEMERQLCDQDIELQELKKRLAEVENVKEFELKMNSRKISALELELENNAKTISNLMAELHCMKVKAAEEFLDANIDANNLPKSVLKSTNKSSLADSNALSKTPDKSASSERPVYVLRSSGLKTGTNANTRTDLALSSGGPAISYLLRNRTRKFVPVSNSNSGSEDGSLISKVERKNSTSSSSPRETEFTTPTPPKDSAPKMRRHSNVKTPVAGNERLSGDLGSRSAGTNRVWSASRKATSTAEQVVPDPAPFLASKSPQIDKAKAIGKKPKLLPPIPARKNAKMLKDAFVENVGTNESDDATVKRSDDLSRLATGRVTEVEVLSLDTSEVQQHLTKYKSTANCN